MYLLANLAVCKCVFEVRDPRNALWKGGPPLCPKLQVGKTLSEMTAIKLFIILYDYEI